MKGLAGAIAGGVLRGGLVLLFGLWWVFIGPIAEWLGFSLPGSDTPAVEARAPSAAEEESDVSDPPPEPSQLPSSTANKP